MFSGKPIPCVGISFGVDRIFSITRARLSSAGAADILRAAEVDVYVMALGSGLLKERMATIKQLWDGGIKAEYTWKAKPKLPQQFKAAETGGVPFAVILGESEWADGKVKLKEMGLPDGHPEKDGVLVGREELVEVVRRKLEAYGSGKSLTERLAELQT